MPALPLPSGGEHREFYGGEGLLYVTVGEFAGQLIDLYEQARRSALAAVFDTVEDLHREGEEGVKEVATMGLLEGIQNVASDRRLDSEDGIG